MAGTSVISKIVYMDPEQSDYDLENQIEIEPNLETHPNDLRILLLDSGTTLDEFEWAPLKNTRELVWDIAQWIEENYSELKSVLGG